MRPGLVIQHDTLPTRVGGLVRNDVAALVAFLERDAWPEEASAGDLLHLLLRRRADLDDHPLRHLVEPAARRAVRDFFVNGGEEVHLYVVCVPSVEALREPGLAEGVLGPLFHQLRAEDDVALIAVPALATMRCQVHRDGAVRWDGETLVDELLTHCRQMTHRFLVLDAPRGLHGDLLTRWFAAFRATRDAHLLGYAAIYYPWLCRGDEVVPPSGSMLGVFARVEREHGRWGVAWPPANTAIEGATHLEVDMDQAETGLVADAGLNPLILQPGRGVVVWGARTLSADPAWIYINSRRIVSMVTEQLRRDTEWAVFEPNTATLWKVVERDVIVRLDEFWSGGLLSGPRAQAEYSVQCNALTNPAEARDRGELNVRVALRPIGTTERIVIDLRLGAPEFG